MKRYLQNTIKISTFIMAFGVCVVVAPSAIYSNTTTNLNTTVMIKEKKCTQCGIVKPLSEFSKRKNTNDGLYYYCKKCDSLNNKLFRNSKNGLIVKMYGHQKDNSKKRGHKPPTYTKEQLTEWLYSETNFERLYDAWVKSDYDKLLIPSIDRINDYKGYTLDNIQLMTWQENNNKAHNDRKKGVNNKHSKAVLQYDLEGNFIKEYYSIHQAERETGIYAYHNLKGRYKSAGGYIWKYKNEEVKQWVG